MMRAALALARRSLGRTWPNPAVGCVMVRDGQVLARGRTREGGRPHAEADAIAQAAEAGQSLKGATAYVTLEPCSHHGRTPPCADALVAAGVSRVVSALEDPDPRVKGQGHARLKAAGLSVEIGVGAAEAAEINAGFLLRVREGRPLFHLKMAGSLDGRIATASGESKWITGEAARRDGQRLRAIHDAILIGATTAAADDPELTCRLPGLGTRSPVRIVLDSQARLSTGSKLATSARVTPVWLVCTKSAPADRRDALSELGVEVIEVDGATDGRIDVLAAARALGARGLTRVLVEGGGQVAASFLKVGLVDGISSYRAGLVLGQDSRSAVGGLEFARLGSAPRFRLVSARPLQGDTLETWRRED
ncbi:bifunctional diaminohydroxyphosphoribosylaminopyrimidine deaminase/5-amino-6-(5-phosphoribosylamino)uracil reductase RibD [Reyranella sp.]|jgi:diaminohydroxyphosphoribosylaminopyrimidine deaminase/5-amino-6-(5-phosphoribosylamino)uracil reductase|uniref:bifunctional diaminohydroxyphosphoribosylaminopyrimidine deaminase/5-amino-6-(5-phosphoribosylamino)uracil reductase RibD n=1 Tax=Reyranella sp. TaxID=1929291 RepID=UPI0026289413|nr:bifunctional diaminohydroxyphosphoribosylaminopyrimidine deaminase/5-amino-6-(5-phosphoribosylamino)uracil reductase RibD [Reyranella sp.]HQS15161.1 bifunctional diaminohydroxyphosphoribosylaminopyrimidine deaminase/5-amino-6-(5-phosphoribosylamino)uracil reductase RibD [Reyranella sp.]HQT10970.1 bifunctional diaminohydroxyphosphoribosylaminopyrimidine deaminase/5-amino-6-(5-phosphoribosylamino)uracil reductase RibD [Reyranella sp.]